MTKDEYNFDDNTIRFQISATHLSPGTLKGVLYSPALNVAMLPTQQINVLVSMDRLETAGGKIQPTPNVSDLSSLPFVLNLFQLASIRSFLLNQVAIRSVLEENLRRDRDMWTRGETMIFKQNIWEDVEIEWLVIEYKRPRRQAESWFMLQISFPWDPEHGPRVATFQNGSLVEFGVT